MPSARSKLRRPSGCSAIRGEAYSQSTKPVKNEFLAYNAEVALLDVVLAYDCNLACDYCTITPAMRQRALSTPAVLAALAQGRALGYDAVSFTGGEPTIRSDLLGLCRAARRLGYTDVKVQSNGLVLAQASNVDRLLAAGVNRIHISIHTHIAAAYDALVRRDGSHALMVAALDHLVARPVALGADVILKTDTAQRLGDAVRWLHGRGVRQADLWFVSLTDGNRDNLASMPRMTEVMPHVHEALAWGRAHAMALRSLHIPRCLLGADAGHAHDPGREPVLVVTPEATFELGQSRLSPQRYVPACERCPDRSLCPGVRQDYLERYGDGEIAAARGQAPRVPATRLLPQVD
jgi:cyclic pyranopterin phosphate synthase